MAAESSGHARELRDGGREAGAYGALEGCRAGSVATGASSSACRMWISAARVRRNCAGPSAREGNAIAAGIRSRLTHLG